VAIDRLQSLHLSAACTERVLTDLLDDLLALTNSTTGVISEVIQDEAGRPVPCSPMGMETPLLLDVQLEVLRGGQPVLYRFPQVEEDYPARLTVPGADLV